MSDAIGMCRSCGKPLRHMVVDLGSQPLADTLLDPISLPQTEAVYPLRVYVCDRCWLVQLQDFAGVEQISRAHAHSSSSYSETLVAHARSWVDELVQRFALTPHDEVIEVGSNDGYLLRHVVARGIRALGVEATDAAQEANAEGIPTKQMPFDVETARRLVQEGHRANVLIGNHNLANVLDLNDFAAAAQILLAPGGTITVEFHHVLQLITKCQFDTICHPHCSYLSLTALLPAFERHGLVIFDAQEVDVHGGSVRAFAARADRDGHPISARVNQLREVESAAGLSDLSTYRRFAARVSEQRRGLLEFLQGAKREGRSVVAYGAPVKGNTLLNYSGVSTDLIAYTVDLSPRKQGRLLPGSRLPIYSPQHIFETRPDFVLILPWTLKDEITRQMVQVRSWGGRFVLPIPEVTVLA